MRQINCLYQIFQFETMLFKYINPIQSFDTSKIMSIKKEELNKLRDEIMDWNLQDNYADQETMCIFGNIISMK